MSMLARGQILRIREQIRLGDGGMLGGALSVKVIIQQRQLTYGLLIGKICDRCYKMAT